VNITRSAERAYLQRSGLAYIDGGHITVGSLPVDSRRPEAARPGTQRVRVIYPAIGGIGRREDLSVQITLRWRL
jgi:hypothetical protein